MLPNSYHNINKTLSQINEQEKIDNSKETIWRELEFDFEKGRFIYEGADQRKLKTKIEVIKQWIKKLFYTERDKWDCYKKDWSYPYGLILHKYIGQQLYPNNFLIEAIKADIYKSLLAHEQIKEIHYLQLIQVEEKMYCGFLVELNDGKGFEIDEVINN